MKCRSCCLWNFHKENRKLSCPKTFFKMSSKTLNHVTLQMSSKQLYMNTKGEKKLRKTWLGALKQRMTVHPEKWGGTVERQVRDCKWAGAEGREWRWTVHEDSWQVTRVFDYFLRSHNFLPFFPLVIFLKTDSLFLICHFLNPSILLWSLGNAGPLVLWQLPRFLRYSVVFCNSISKFFRCSGVSSA